jgi:methionine-S-sulfoxide reductase
VAVASLAAVVEEVVAVAGKTEIAFLAAGCFWGVQAYYDDLPGVLSTEVGYMGGHVPDPTYKQVCTQITGHAETTKIIFDPTKISYHDILEHFFRMHNPTTPNQDGPNIGTSYRSAIFYPSEQQHRQAQQVIDELTAMQKFESPIITEVSQAGLFYLAEEYHRKYFQKTGEGACHVWPSEVDIAS